MSGLNFSISDDLWFAGKYRKEIELSSRKNQSWYFTNAIFGFENGISFAFLNDGQGVPDPGFYPPGVVCNCAHGLKNTNLHP